VVLSYHDDRILCSIQYSINERFAAEHVVLERPEKRLVLDGASVAGHDRNTHTESAPVELRIFGVPNCPAFRAAAIKIIEELRVCLWRCSAKIM